MDVASDAVGLSDFLNPQNPKIHTRIVVFNLVAYLEHISSRWLNQRDVLPAVRC